MKSCRSGKAYVVTGGARGIGFAICHRLLTEGASVIMADIDSDAVHEAADQTAQSAAIPFGVDLTDQAQRDALFSEARERFGRIDGLVNNAAVLDVSATVTLDCGRYQEVIETNLNAALFCCLAALPLFPSEGGAIVNVSSIMGLYGTPNSIPYSVAKAGMINMTRCLAVDLADRDITVNAIAPGFIETRMSQLTDGTSEYATTMFQDVFMKHRRLPAGRTGKAEDVAGPAAFLLSDDARYMTGQVLTVDGGVTATY